jgi:drug/metabolite transporter (DMT)-like permease
MSRPSDHSLVTRVWRSSYILLTLAVLFWSGNFIVGRATAGIVPPVALAFWRWTIGLALVLCLGMAHVRRDWGTLARHWRILIVLGALGIAAFNTLVYFGLQATTAVNALLLQSAMPVIILAATFLLYGERPNGRQALGVLVSIIGVIIIATKGDWGTLVQMTFNPGDLWVLLAVAAYALYSTMLRKRPAVHPLSFLAATFAIGALMLAPLYIHEHAAAQVQPVRAAYLAIAYVAVFPGFVSYLLYNRGVELVGANAAGHFMHLMPIFGSGLAILLLGERFAGFHLAGAFFIAAGLGLATFRRRQ